MVGRIVIAFQSPAFDFGQLYVMAQADPPDFLRPAPGQLWFHIGLRYLRPYRPTLHALSRSSARPLVEGGVSLTADWVFSALFAAIAELDRERPWWAQLSAMGERRACDGVRPRRVVHPQACGASPLLVAPATAAQFPEAAASRRR